ncbi:universal stress protein UspE [Aliiglaciecola sp. LCG003]|uniref:universal stress protein UspE n=1 Tax=Aliiglaciecola sp. LCG003 TaxID=3053655 RepID=UPI0025725910|nr:universal stress protein UspE [Aliiglaciecola sp. LCG003]WJG07600.1 universal stress protein UspE [Aliiglaciecola sp. LCG003]
MSAFNKILAVMDPSVTQQKSLLRAMNIAQKTGASITALLCIYDFSYEMTTMLSIDERETMRQAIVDEKTDWLADIVEPLVTGCSQSVDIKVVWHNRPFESILYEVIDNSYDLIVKGTQQHDSLKSVIFTPTDWHLLRKSPVPVLLVKDHDWPDNGNVLAAIDINTEDEEHKNLNHKVSQSCQVFAQLLNGNANLVNSYAGTPVNIAIEIPEFDPVGYTEAVKQHHIDAMHEHGAQYKISPARIYVREGLPEHVIPQIAEEIDAELLIMGSIGRTGITAALMGNTAEHVVDSLNCDILALKPDEFDCPIKR